MGFYSQEKCSACNANFTKTVLVKMTVQFTPVTEPRRILKSRTVHWLCPECLEKNEFWLIEPFKAPGTRSAGLERVRALEEKKKHA